MAERERGRERNRARERASSFCSGTSGNSQSDSETERQGQTETETETGRERECVCVCEREREIVAHTFAHPAQRTQTIAAVASRLFCCSSPVLYARMFLSYLHILGKKKNVLTVVVSTRTRALY